LKPIIVDPGLYLSEGTEMFYATQKRELPSAYRMFTGVFGSPYIVSNKRFGFSLLFDYYRVCHFIKEYVSHIYA